MASRRTTTVVLLVVALGAAGCGGSSHAASPTTPPTTTAPPATTAAPATTAPPSTAPTTTPGVSTTVAPTVTTAPPGPQPCTTSDLQLALTSPSGAAGSTYVTLVLRATGPACTVQGYPGVSYVTGPSGTQVGAAATRTPGATPLVALGHGQAAQSTLRLVDPGVFDPSQCQPVATTGLRIYPPGQTAAGFVAQPGQACANSHLAQPALYVGPLVAASSTP